jgi:hypothetical protein
VSSLGRTSMIVVNAALTALFTVILATETGTLAADHQNVALSCVGATAPGQRRLAWVRPWQLR